MLKKKAQNLNHNYSIVWTQYLLEAVEFDNSEEAIIFSFGFVADRSGYRWSFDFAEFPKTSIAKNKKAHKIYTKKILKQTRRRYREIEKQKQENEPDWEVCESSMKIFFENLGFEKWEKWGNGWEEEEKTVSISEEKLKSGFLFWERFERQIGFYIAKIMLFFLFFFLFGREMEIVDPTATLKIWW